jgi:hypothetical protein
MLTSIQGVYRDGRIELSENPTNVPDGTLAIITFMEFGDHDIDLVTQGIDQGQAKVLKESLTTFADDWNNPEMSIYDDYDAAKNNH